MWQREHSLPHHHTAARPFFSCEQIASLETPWQTAQSLHSLPGSSWRNPALHMVILLPAGMIWTLELKSRINSSAWRWTRSGSRSHRGHQPSIDACSPFRDFVHQSTKLSSVFWFVSWLWNNFCTLSCSGRKTMVYKHDTTLCMRMLIRPMNWHYRTVLS